MAFSKVIILFFSYSQLPYQGLAHQEILNSLEKENKESFKNTFFEIETIYLGEG
jgi:hypothetical protein